MLDEMYPPQRNLSGRSEDGTDDAEIGRQWREDSSLEKWFPITAEQLARSIRMTELQDQRIQALEAENAALKREAHTWSKAAEHYAKPLEPLDPLDVEDLWDVANADPYADEVHHEFARLLQRKLGIGA
jgi:hypothetical protein